MRPITNAVLVGFLGLFLLIIAGAGCTNNQKQAADTNNVSTANFSGSDTLATESNITAEIRPSDTETTVPNRPATVTPSAAAKSYAMAVREFGESGYRYQFASCSGLPGKFTVKKGVRFMLDNRDAKRHVLKISRNAYTIPAYGYAIVTVNTPGAHMVTCDGGGAAEVLVQN